jgi:hypothetical protein
MRRHRIHKDATFAEGAIDRQGVASSERGMEGAQGFGTDLIPSGMG